jgi:hypothetical protein
MSASSSASCWLFATGGHICGDAVFWYARITSVSSFCLTSASRPSRSITGWASCSASTSRSSTRPGAPTRWQTLSPGATQTSRRYSPSPAPASTSSPASARPTTQIQIWRRSGRSSSLASDPALGLSSMDWLRSMAASSFRRRLRSSTSSSPSCTRTATRESNGRCTAYVGIVTPPNFDASSRTSSAPAQRANATSRSTYIRLALLLPLPVPTAVWTDIGLDFVEALPCVGGKSVILTVVDRFSKYCHFIPLGHPYTAESVAQAFFAEIVRLHSVPQSMVSDRNPVFTSVFWQELMRLIGAKIHMTSAFHPQSDGQTKAANKVITMYLRCFTGDRPRQWLRWLPWVEYIYNTAYQSALHDTSFRVVYGQDPPSIRNGRQEHGGT